METTTGGDITRTHAEDVLELPKVLKLLSNHCQTEPAKTRAENLAPMQDRGAVEAELEQVTQIIRSGQTASFFLPFEPGYIRLRIVETGSDP